MRPNGEELLRGIQATLATYILPELQTEHARFELMLALRLLAALADGWDGAAQRLVEDNAALRALARRGADALDGGDTLGGELRALADETDPSFRLSDLSAANLRLREALVRLAQRAAEGNAAAFGDLRAAVIERLRADAEDCSLSLLGPRADG